MKKNILKYYMKKKKEEEYPSNGKQKKQKNNTPAYAQTSTRNVVQHELRDKQDRQEEEQKSKHQTSTQTHTHIIYTHTTERRMSCRILIQQESKSGRPNQAKTGKEMGGGGSEKSVFR